MLPVNTKLTYIKLNHIILHVDVYQRWRGKHNLRP